MSGAVAEAEEEGEARGAGGSVLADVCGMGANASFLADRGLEMGLSVGLVAGAATGSVSASAAGALSRALALETHEALNCRLVTGMVTGGPVAIVLGTSCAAVGTVAGGVVGMVEDIRQDLAGALKRACVGMAARLMKPAARVALGLSFNLQDGSRKIAQLPQEALPFLGALVSARRAGVLSEEAAFGRAAGFAARCALEVAARELPGEAERQGRLVRALVQLRACYAREGEEALEEAARRLLEGLGDDTLDAVWLAFGPTSLQQWAYGSRGLLPRLSSDLSGDLLLRALDMRYEEERGKMVNILRESFPGGDGEDYHKMFEILHAALPRASLWKGYRLLQGGCQPRFPFAAVQNLEAVERARAYLSACPLPDVPSEDERVAGLGVSPELPSELCRGGGPLSLFLPGPATMAPPPAVIKAVEQVQGSLAAAEAGGEQGGLWLEVLRATGVRRPDGSRVADAAAWLLGARCRSISVLVALGEVGEARSRPSAVPTRTRTVSADAAGCADVGEAVSFPLGTGDVLGTLELLEVKFQVLEHRPLLGEALFGSGRLRLNDKMLGAFEVHTVDLVREGVCKGSLLVRAGVLTPPSAFGILKHSSKEPLAVVLKAFSHLLAQPGCVALLMDSRPREVLDKQLVEEPAVHKMLQSWVVTFCACASHLRSSADEAEAVRRFARVARAARSIAAECAGLPEDEREVEDLMVEWLRGFCARCGGADDEVELDEARLAHILEASRVQCKRLEDLGVTLPAKLPADLAAEVHARLLEAEAGEEREIFTGVRIVRNGQVASGLAAVVVRGRGNGQRPHIFLYAHAAIKEWQQEHRSDPCTREALTKQDILPLTAY